MRPFAASVASLAVLMFATAAEGRCKPREIWGDYAVLVSGFTYDWDYGCDLGPQGCGMNDHTFTTCTFKITRNSNRVTNLNISCPTRTIPSDRGFKPFNTDCVGGCPHHQLHAVGRDCDWDLVDLNGDIYYGDIIYRVTFSADRRSFIAKGAAGPHSDSEHDGRSGNAAALFGIRQ